MFIYNTENIVYFTTTEVSIFNVSHLKLLETRFIWYNFQLDFNKDENVCNFLIYLVSGLYSLSVFSPLTLLGILNKTVWNKFAI